MSEAIILTVESVRTRASTNEALVTFAVPLEHANLVSSFMSQVGQQVGAAFARIEPNGIKPSVPAPSSAKRKTPFGSEARDLKLSGFLRVEAVWRALGTDAEFREWIQSQPSAWSGEFDYDPNLTHDPACEAAHVSRLEYGRGMNLKPEYSCVPLTRKEHMNHHAKGESVFDLPEQRTDGGFGVVSGRDWMERMRIKYVELWAWDRLKATLGYGSMSDVPPRLVREWANKFNVEQYLPQSYRDAQD